MTTQTVGCDSKVCDGHRATVRGNNTYNRTAVDNLVGVAWSPLAVSASAKQHGPWKKA